MRNCDESWANVFCIPRYFIVIYLEIEVYLKVLTEKGCVSMYIIVAKSKQTVEHYSAVARFDAGPDL